MRSALGATISRVRASPYARLLFSMRARTRSPGRAPATKTTKPPARAAPFPPYARRSTVSSSSSPGRGRADLGGADTASTLGPELGLDRREDRLAVRVAALVVAHLAQL